MNKELKLKELDNLTDEIIINDLKAMNNSYLTFEAIANKDYKLIDKLSDRLKKIDYQLQKETMLFICSHIITNNISIFSGEKIVDDINYFDDVEIHEFPINEFPNLLGKYVLQISESLQVAPDMPAVVMLAVLATCIQGKYIVQIKRDWSEPLNLFCSIIAPPAERKSAVMSLLTAPLLQYEQKENERIKPLKEKYKLDKQALEQAKDRYIKEKYSKKGTDIDINDITKRMKVLEEVKDINLFTSDVTTEKLSSLLANNSGRMSVISAEAGIFDIMAGKYNQNSNNFDIYLQGHAGDVIRIDRVGRDRETINNPRLTLLLATQPSVIETILKNKSFRGKGLLARFLYSYPKSRVGTRKFDTEPIDENLKEKYNTLITSLLDIKFKDECIIYMSKEARAELEEFFYEIEDKIKYEYRNIADWVGKLVGATARISGLLHISNGNNSEIDRQTVKSAINIAKYFLTNAISIFDGTSIEQDILDAKYILEYINNNEIYYFSDRDILRNRRRFKTNEDFRGGINVLIDRKYLYKVGLKYIVNPNYYNFN